MDGGQPVWSHNDYGRTLPHNPKKPIHSPILGTVGITSMVSRPNCNLPSTPFCIILRATVQCLGRDELLRVWCSKCCAQCPVPLEVGRIACPMTCVMCVRHTAL